MSTEKGKFTISYLMRAGFRIEQDGGFNYLSKQTDFGTLVTNDFEDILQENPDKPIARVYKLGRHSNFNDALTEMDLETALLPKL